MAVTAAQKRRIKEEAGFQCAVPVCTVTSPLQIHHIVDRAQNGTDTDDNLICLCSNHHGLYHEGIISRQSILNYKHRLNRVNITLAIHEFRFLDELNNNEEIQLDDENLHLARNLERLGFITITNIGNNLNRLNITNGGRVFIQ